MIAVDLDIMFNFIQVKSPTFEVQLHSSDIWSFLPKILWIAHFIYSRTPDPKKTVRDERGVHYADPTPDLFCEMSRSAASRRTAFMPPT